MGRRETTAQREERRLRNKAKRLEQVARQPDRRPMSPRRVQENQRTLDKMRAADEAWGLVLKAAAELAPPPAGFKYAGLAFHVPADAKAYREELDQALAAAGEEGKTPIGRWRAWASIALPWIERRRLRPIPVSAGQLPRARIYPDGALRLVAPTDGDMVALLSRLANAPGAAPVAPVVPAPSGGA